MTNREYLRFNCYGLLELSTSLTSSRLVVSDESDAMTDAVLPAGARLFQPHKEQLLGKYEVDSAETANKIIRQPLKYASK